MISRGEGTRTTFRLEDGGKLREARGSVDSNRMEREEGAVRTMGSGTFRQGIGMSERR